MLEVFLNARCRTGLKRVLAQMLFACAFAPAMFGQATRTYLYDARGDAASALVNAEFALQVEQGKVHSIFTLFRGGQLLRIGNVESVDARSLNSCIFGDFLGFDASGNIIEAQKDFGGYKLRSAYYADGKVAEYDSLVNNKVEGNRYALSRDGKVVSITKYHNGEPSKPYYTVLAEDGGLCYNSGLDKRENFTMPVCYTEATVNTLLSQTYTANGLRMTTTVQSTHSADDLYTLRITIKNTSPDSISFKPSNIKAWGGSSRYPSADINALKVLSAEDHAMTLNRADIVEMVRQYVQPTDIEPYHEYSGSVRIKADGSEWLAVAVGIGNITYPFYFSLSSGASKDNINSAVIGTGEANGILAKADAQSANKIFNDGRPFPKFDVNKAMSLAKKVSDDMESSLAAMASNMRSRQASVSGSLNAPSLSTTFVKRANTCVSCIKRLESAKNADQVYSACVTYYKTYKTLRAMRKNANESKIFNSIHQAFAQSSNKVSQKLRCSGTIMKAQLDGLK